MLDRAVAVLVAKASPGLEGSEACREGICGPQERENDLGA
jgi:hypothetical protein